MIFVATVLVCFSLLGWLYLALFHGRFWQPLLFEASPEPATWPAIDIIIPARDEAAVLPQSLPSLLRQDYPGAWRVILVDDHSTDGTSDGARKIATTEQCEERLTVVVAPDLPKGWSGKLAAMQAGVAQSHAAYILFTDADIEHPRDSLRRLAARAVDRELDLVSLMVRLHCESVAEKLLIPAFVFFFALLYPFRRANNPNSDVAAAAGGVMLVKRQALDNSGGLAAIKSALIDDCALAKIIKRGGGDHAAAGRNELTLARDVKSLRAYPAVRDIWRMIARTAYTQLRYSPGLLAATVLGMGILFLLPISLPVTGRPLITEAGMGAWFVMLLIYMPMVRFYRLSFVWAVMLPAAGLIYIAATIDSARLYWQGKGGVWKGRIRGQGPEISLSGDQT